jgi:hypothetical protein
MDLSAQDINKSEPKLIKNPYSLSEPEVEIIEATTPVEP